MTSVAIRTMTRADIPAAYALEQVLYPADAWSLGQFVDEIERVPTTRHYIALTMGEQLIGYAGLLMPRPGADADIQTLSVAPEHQRHGYGELLLDALMTEARKRGAPALFLEVRVDNEAALALYAKKGFQTLGRRRDYYGPGIDATTMRLILENSQAVN